jgi:chromosome segregation ATPase
MEQDLSELIARKEKELQDISKLRLIQLEDQIKQKTQHIDSLTEKLRTIQEDFNYNVKLIDDRDAELHELESKYVALQKTQKQKDCEISELRGLVAATEQRIKQESNKIKSQERVLADSRDQLREELTDLKWKKEEEARKFSKIIDDLEKQQNRLIRSREQEINELKQVLTLKHEQILSDLQQRHSSELNSLLQDLQEKDLKIQILSKDRKDLQDKLQKIIEEDLVSRLEQEHFEQLREKTLIISEKDIQINKLIDHSNHLAQQMETIKSQQESEADFWENQKDFYEKELTKLKNASKEEVNFLRESHEIQVQRLNSTFTSQINRLQQRLAQAEEDSEKNYLQTLQMREKFLNIEKKSFSEVSKVESQYQKDLEIAEENLKNLRQDLLAKDSEIRTLQENLGSWKARSDQFLEEGKKLRVQIQEYEIEVSSLKNEIQAFKEMKNFQKDQMVQSLKEEYEKKLREVAGVKKNENWKNEEFPKIWSEDLGPASSIKSSNQELLAENEELKRIIEEMRAEIEFINNQGVEDIGEVQRLRENVAKLRNEIIKITTERDQLLDISSELKAELRMLGYNKSVQVVQPPIVEQIEEMQEGLRMIDDPIKSLPKYDDFEEIMNSEPVKEEKRFQKANSNRETASQKEVHSRIRANLKKTKKPSVRNYNIKE